MKHKKIAILGTTGMLGYAINTFFNQKKYYQVHAYSRKENNQNFFDAFEYLKNDEKDFSNYDYVINCIGGIKQKKYDEDTLKSINTTFPLLLAKNCHLQNVKLIHVSTDCVFGGDKKFSTEITQPNPIDYYGYSKYKGEPNNCMVIRTSLVGKEPYNQVSLFEWAKSKSGQTIKGYTNNFWNGITTLQFANCCDKIISNDYYEIGIKHIFSPNQLSKAQILEIFNKKFNLNLNIQHVESDIKIDRTLGTVYSLCEKLEIPDFINQPI